MPIVSTPSETVTLTRDLQLVKASSSIVLTVPGIVTLNRLLEREHQHYSA
ncbi:MAG: hypothetical protein IIT49_06145 [Clostridia bacterium]|nr:hypothetical protein [Clostridia bacterium]MBQ5440349.1 hypothetical protein [Clostridia bacterium]